MNTIEIIGTLANLFTISAFVVEVVKSIKNYEMASFSLFTLLVYSTGSLLWIYYGFLIESSSIIISGVATVSLNMILIGMTYRKRAYLKKLTLKILNSPEFQKA